MAIIWGFNLSEMRWGAFGSRNMFDRQWHLRRERFIVYQLAMLIGLAAECTATYSLAKYGDLQDHIESMSGYTAQVHNNRIIDAAIVTIIFCVLVATVFGADFFFLLFWPQRRYPAWYDVTKKLFAVVISMGMAAATLASTIIIARQSVWITGVDAETAKQYTDLYFRPPLVYRRWPTNIAWVVLLWPAFLSTVASTYIMFIASAHDRTFGTAPKSNGIADEKEDTESLKVRSGESKSKSQSPLPSKLPPQLPFQAQSKEDILPSDGAVSEKPSVGEARADPMIAPVEGSTIPAAPAPAHVHSPAAERIGRI